MGLRRRREENGRRARLAAGKKIDVVICTVDRLKRDAEVKLLIGCTEEEKALVCNFHNDGKYMGGILIRRGSIYRIDTRAFFGFA